MSSEDETQGSKRDIKTTVDKIRQDLTHASKDIGKFVQETAPKVAATIDESLERASQTFDKTMRTIDTQTKPQQIKLLQAYRTFLSKQVDAIEKRLNKLKQ